MVLDYGQNVELLYTWVTNFNYFEKAFIFIKNFSLQDEIIFLKSKLRLFRYPTRPLKKIP
jgi:hypothetical protein